MFLKYHPRAWSPGHEHCLCLCARVHTQTPTRGCTHACLLTHVLRLPPNQAPHTSTSVWMCVSVPSPTAHPCWELAFIPHNS